MAITLIKETGSGSSLSNTYASATDCTAYHDGHLYATAWTAASSGDKDKALAMATRLIDSEFRFNGYKVSQTQALQWPRRLCIDPDSDQISAFASAQVAASGAYVPSDSVPKAVLNATCELARRLLEANRTSDPAGEGLSSLEIAGAVSLTFDQTSQQQPLPREVSRMLEPYGRSSSATSGTVKLVRT